MNKFVKILDKLNNVKKRIYVIIGLFFSLIAYLPNLILQKGSVFVTQDQLDGELFTYIFAAKHLGKGVKTYSEMFNGISVDGLKMPAPFFVFFFKVFEPFSAFLAMHIVISCLAFLGMYLLIEKCYKNKVVAFVAGGVFAYLPFFGVYGLSIMGIPLLVYAFLNLMENKSKSLSYVLILIYALTSSFALVGFAILINLFVLLIYLLAKKKKKKFLNVCLGGAILIVVYSVLNFSLIKQVLSISKDAMVSHKVAITVYAAPFWSSFKEYFFTGSFHMQSHQKFIVCIALITILFGIIQRKNNTIQAEKLLHSMTFIYAYNILVSLLCALLAIEPVVKWRNEVGGVIKYFQLNRISWVTPFTWYFVFAIVMLYWIEYIRNSGKRKLRSFFAICVLLVFVLGVAGNVLYNSTFKVNVRQMVDPDTSYYITWDKYYNEKLFEEIKSYIGIPQEDYRVISLLIEPSMALYNGFYCLDGYSNNYDLEYKKAFREIMEKELDKNEALRNYYDKWGNRCYLLSNEFPLYFFCDKWDKRVIQDFSLNTEQLYEMGGRYLFSGMYIVNYEELNLQYEKYFEREDSLIGVHLYKIME